MAFGTIPKSDDVLLAECDVETFRASGPGGQNVNRRSTAVRLRHRPTGIVVTCQRERTQYVNKRIALAQLRRRLEALFRRRRPRIPTAKPRSAKNKILARKRRHSLKKQFRKRAGMED
ncbi:MAG: peptide chain release factor-like protein [Phycisphaerae bacterium]|nr:peptide chain release factor-like protein [Phycisphaerae bacterium]